MPELRVNPNRMELLRLKRRRQVAERGHKLLKDKLEELMKEFLSRIDETTRLRAQAESVLASAHTSLAIARAEAGRTVLPPSPQDARRATVCVEERVVMSVKTPHFSELESPEKTPYSLAATPAIVDAVQERFSDAVTELVQLAELEKVIELLAAEIESTRRRVNALEHILIPQLDDAIRGIGMKLDEAERSSLTRLMKVKDMIAQRDETGL